MKLFKFIHLAIVVTIFTCIQAQAAVAIIVHPSNADTINISHVAKIFLGKQKSFPSGDTALPIDLSEGSATKESFSSTVLKRNSSQLKAYWSKLMFTGKGTPPKSIATDAEVIDLVSKNPAIIGYIDAAAVNDSVKVIHKF